jgi:transketolase
MAISETSLRDAGLLAIEEINAAGGVLGYPIEPVYCLVGDGESNEGTIYESLLLASQHNLDNLCLIVDNNKSIDNALSLGSFEQKAISFGWHVESIIGHNHCDLENALSVKVNKPKCIVAHTIKGYGIKRIQDDPQKWHHSFPTEKEYAEILEELSL